MYTCMILPSPEFLYDVYGVIMVMPSKKTMKINHPHGILILQRIEILQQMLSTALDKSHKKV